MSKKIKKLLKNKRGHGKKTKKVPGPPKVSSQEGILQHALTLHQTGHLSEAEALYRQILTVEPDNADALHYLGMLAHQVGKSEIAIELISKSLRCRPDYIAAHNSQGIILNDLGRLEEAVASFRKALTLKPDFAEVHSNLGNTLKDQGKLEEAVASFRQALALKPDFAEVYYNLGIVLADQDKMDEAIASYQRAIALKPEHAKAHSNLGNVLVAQDRLEEAVASFRQALVLQPDFTEALSNLGNTLKTQGQHDEAVASLRQALVLKPDFADARSNLLLCLNYLPSQYKFHYLEEARLYGRKATEKVSTPFVAWPCAAETKRLRIGMVSGDFRNHPVGFFLENVLLNIDPTKIELVAYPTHSEEDELTARLRPGFSAWKPVHGMSDEAAASLIHDDGLHILLDLSGHTTYNRLPVFAWKPAPVQATWLGYFASTGLAEMDYIIADPVSVPESLKEHFTEKVWYLPDIRICFSPPLVAEELAPTPLPALDNGYITFGCFQNLAKINDEVLALWGRVMQALPQARLRLQNLSLNSPAIREQVQQRLARCGIAAERVMLEKSVPRKDYLAAHAQIDIILDTFPFPGGTTTCEALWMGVPTVTLAGNTMLARQGASLLACAGLDDWIATDEEDFAAKAVAHASDLEKLARLRAGLREQVLASPLFDAPRFARNFEEAMWGMWRRFQAGG